MARLIDADALMGKQYYVEYWNGSGESEDTVVSIVEIENAPTVDAVEVVRCRECKYRYVDGDNVRFNLCLLNHNKVQSDDWYCADGERKGGADDADS